MKPERRQEIERSLSYRTISAMATVMDKYMLDPLLGLIPGAGDLIGSLFALPFVYVSLCKVRSVPLTLAVVYYNMVDLVIGLLPFWVGNVLDFFVRANLRNFRLIQGFVEGDEEIKHEVNRKAVYMAVMIVVLLALTVLLFMLLARLVEYVGTLFA